MKDLRKSLTLAVAGIALVLGAFVLTSNAQHRRGRGGVSFSISYGQPYYPQYRSYRRHRQPRYYVTQPYYGYGYNNGYYNNGYNRRYNRSRRYDRNDRYCDRSYRRNYSYNRGRRNW